MIGKKGFFILILCLSALSLYSWFGIIQPEKEGVASKVQLFPNKFAENLISFDLTVGDSDIRLEKRKDFWWVVAPDEYLADQEFIEKGLQIMTETKPNHQFTLDVDRFGLKPGKAFLNFSLSTGQQKRLKVGTETGPDDSIYVLDTDSSTVFAVHNVWGQFFYYPLKRMYHPYLPIPGRMVKSIKLFNKEKLVWSVVSASASHLRLGHRDQSKIVGKANALWLFQKLREFPLENIEFGEKLAFDGPQRLEIETDQGNIIFVFDEKAEKIWIKSFNVFAQIAPYSLKSLGYEIEKVIKSDKK